MSDTKKLVFLDIETTGLDPIRHEILEVAMIKRTDSVPGADQEVTFSLNIDPLAAEPRALEVNRYEERKDALAEAQVPDSFASRILFGTLKDAIVIGNNPQFDLRFIEAFLRRNAFEVLGIGMPFTPTPWNYHPVDLKALVAGKLGLGEPPWSTKQIARESGVPLPEDAHAAFADAAWNRDVYDSVFHYKRTRCTCGAELPHRSKGDA